MRNAQAKKLHFSKQQSALVKITAEMAHEINTPLSAILLKLERMREVAATDEVESLEQLIDEVDSLTSRINRIVRSHSEMARDPESIPLEPTNLRNVIDEALDIMCHKLELLGVCVRLSMPRKKLVISCRPTQLTQVLVNLLKNSCEAIEVGKKKWIRIKVEKTNNRVFIRVFDSGVPIPNHVKRRIFRPFFTTKKNQNGLGIGLNLSKKMIQFHGGDLYLDSDVENTCFVVELPM